MLTAVAVKSVKPKEKAHRLFDTKGLYLEVSPKGGKWWRLKYRFEGRERRMSLGVYPNVSLRDARERRDEARKRVAHGIDPQKEREAHKNGRGTFEALAREWFLKYEKTWVPAHGDRIIRRFERDIFPWLGKQRIEQVEPLDILTVLRRIEDRGAIETAHRAMQNCSQVFRYAVATGRAKRDPTVDLRGAIPPAKERHHAAITDPAQVGELLRATKDYKGFFPTKCALMFAPLVFVRPVELRTAEWEEMDFERAEWNIPARKMKMREPHLVPLPRQALAILEELHPLTGNGQYLFPSIRTRTRPMSENTVNGALRRLGYPKDVMTGHGFRAMARTMLDEQLGFRPDYIEQQLAHRVRDPLGRAYNRTKHVKERRVMMQAWADYLEGLRDGDTKKT